MTDDFLFSLNSAAPIFIVFLAGYLIKARGIIDGAFIRQANRLIYFVALPIKLFLDVSKTSFQADFHWRFIIIIVLLTILSVPFLAGIASLVINDPWRRGAFVQGAFRGNFLYVGYSILENVMGTVGYKTHVAFAFVVPLYNILAILVLTYYSNSGANVQLKSILRSIFTNPLILSILAGSLFSLAGFTLPVLAERSFSYFGALVTPMALLMIGAAFRPEMIRQNIKLSFLAASLKLVVLPLLAVLIAQAMGLDAESVVIIYVIFGVPTAVTSYTFARIMGADEDLASGIIMLSTLLSIITMTLFIFAFKSSGLL